MSAQPTAGQSTGMTLERLQRILDAHGADPDRWPDSERAAAEALVARSAEARGVIARARTLDAALADLPADVPDAAMARLVAATAFPPPRRGAARAEGTVAGGWMNGLASLFWPRAAALATMAALGIVVGLASEPVYSNSDDGYFVTSLASNDLTVETIEELVP